jgi:hypothetical protein
MKISLGAVLVAAASVAAPLSAPAAGTQFKGRITVTMNVALLHPLTQSQVLYCSASAVASDAGGEQFKAQSIIQATQRTSTSYVCTPIVPYNWVNQSTSGDQMDIQITYEALIFDSAIGLNDLGVGLMSAQGNYKTPVITTGQFFTYTTPVSLY